jgi:DNA-binding winged helix-turn-helix (wHTH) protein/Tfp pilus assembly protein PilF
MKDESLSETSIGFGPFTFDKAVGKLSKYGTAVRLRGMPLKILHQLVEHPGEVVSRVELQRLLWNGTAFGDFEQGLNSAVNVVRKSLRDSADQPRYIETVPGQGYRFIAPLRSLAPVEANTSGAALDFGSTATDPNERAESAREVREAPVAHKTTSLWLRWGVAAALGLVALGGGAWWTFRPAPPVLIDGARPSANRDANEQYNLAQNFQTFQNDLPLARKTFERALELDPHFASARLQHALLLIIEIYNGYANDESILLQAEEDLHEAEKQLPSDNGLLLAAQAGVYLAEGRLDRIPSTKLEEWWRKGGDNGKAPPVWVVNLRLLKGQTDEPLAIIRKRVETNPLENPTRMLQGELLRMQGDSEGAIHVLERVVQQGPRHPTPAWFLTMAYLDAGKPKQARALLERMRPEFEKNYQWRHAWAIVLAADGKHEEAREAMNEDTLKFARLTWTVTSGTADFYALQADPSKAIEWLQLAVSRGDERVAYFRRNSRLATLRNDPRFQSLLKSVEARKTAK